MTHQLRGHTDSATNQRLFPNNHTEQVHQSFNFSLRLSDALFWPHWTPVLKDTGTHKETNTYTQIKNKNKL